MKIQMKSIILGIMMIMIIGCAKVGPQEGGVRTSMIGFSRGFGESEWFKRGIKSKPLEPGLYVHIPNFSEVDKYEVNELRYHMFKESEHGRDDISFKTKDGQTAWIDVSIRYRLIFEKLPKIHREYGHDYIDNVIRPTIRSLVNNKLGEYSAEEIYDGQTRQKVSQEIRQLVNDGYEGQHGTREMGLEIIDVLFRRYEFTDEYQAAIEQKRIASEQHLAAVEWAKKREAEAMGEKMAMIQMAEGEAEKIKMESDAALYAKLKEAEGVEALGQANAKVQGALATAIGGGDLLVKLEFAKRLSESLKIWGIPVGDQSNQFMDLSGIFGEMFPKQTTPGN